MTSITPQFTNSRYAAHLRDSAAIRRFTGPAGPTRTAVDIPCRARVRGAGAGVLVGDVMQTGYLAVVLVEDLVAGGLTLPVTTADKLVWRGRELAISFPDNATRGVDDELVAYVLSVKG